jgi:hypothetical protein
MNVAIARLGQEPPRKEILEDMPALGEAARLDMEKAMAHAKLVLEGPYKFYFVHYTRQMEEAEERLSLLDAVRRMCQNEEVFDGLVITVSGMIAQQIDVVNKRRHTLGLTHLLGNDDPEGVLLRYMNALWTPFNKYSGKKNNRGETTLPAQLLSIAAQNNVKPAVDSIGFVLDRKAEWKRFSETDGRRVREAQELVVTMMINAEAEGHRDAKRVHEFVSRLEMITSLFWNPPAKKEVVSSPDAEDSGDLEGSYED